MELPGNPTTRAKPGSQQNLHLSVLASSASADSSETQPILPLRDHRDPDHHCRTICRLQPWPMPANRQVVGH